MNDVETERRLDDAAGAANVEPKRRIFEPLDHLTSAETTQITPRLCGAAIGVLARQRGEAGATSKLLFDARDLCFSLLFAARRGGTLRAGVHE